MKYLGYVFLCTSFILYSHPEEHFLLGNQLYNQKLYADALAEYDKIQIKGSSVWHNMGNCAYYLQEYAQAYAYWLSALHTVASRSNKKMLINNISLLQTYGMPTLYVSFWEKVPLFWMQIAFLIFWYVLLSYIWIKSLSVRRKMIFFCIGIVLFLSVLLMTQYIESIFYGVIKTHEVSLYAGPNELFHKRGPVPYGSAVRVKQHMKQWSKIQINQQSGWVKTDELIMVQE